MQPQHNAKDQAIEKKVLVKWLGRQDYLSIWKDMQAFTNQRNEQTQDEIWLVEHEPVFTQGQNGKEEHLLNAGHIPCIHSDRGGQITYHGPGQLMVYTLIDIRRKQFNVRELVTKLEQAVIDYLAQYQIFAKAKCEAPGVYINDDKICSIGLRIRRGCAYHGIAFNIAMDLTPFSQINPCGFKALKMTQLANFIQPDAIEQIGYQLIGFLQKNLGYTSSSSDQLVS